MPDHAAASTPRTREQRERAEIARVDLIVGLEIHVELATRSKLFTRVGSPACREFEDAAPNTLVDPVVLALPGALPVINRRAVEMSVRVGLALGCHIAQTTTWDRKSYFYPDLPKAYQISQYDQPVCGSGRVTWPVADNGEDLTIGIERAHLEEDAGKLMHEAPADMPELRREMTEAGGVSIVDLNRAGTPLLEIVTAPDFTDAGDVERFARMLRRVCRTLGVTEGDMQKGHMRFEPNVNCRLTLAGEHAGLTVATPISEIKNLNSFRSVRAAIEYEQRAQVERWRADGIEQGPATKSTWGWDDARNETVLQRSKEDALDYRYFRDPDLPPLRIDPAWVGTLRDDLPEMPFETARRYTEDFGIDEKTAWTIADEPGEARLIDAAVGIITREHKLPLKAAGKHAANVVTQAARAIANERSATIDTLGLTPEHVAAIAQLRDTGEIDSAAVPELIRAAIDEPGTDIRAAAEHLGLLKVKDTAALETWVNTVLDDPTNAATVDDVRSGKDAAIGRLIGAVMKASHGKADAKDARALIIEKLR